MFIYDPIRGGITSICVPVATTHRLWDSGPRPDAYIIQVLGCHFKIK